MAAIQSPIKVYKLWRRGNERFGPGRDFKKKAKDKTNSTKDKQSFKQNEQINKGIILLRNAARGGLAKSPSKIKAFEKIRAKTLRIMKKFCKLVKSANAKDLAKSVADLTKYRRFIKQITVIVEELNPSAMGAEIADDASEADLFDLEAVDLSALDQAMEKADFGDYPDEEFDEDVDEDEAGEDEAEESASGQPATDDAERWAQRRKELEPQLLVALKEKKANYDKMHEVFSYAQEKAKSQDFANALLGLNNLEKLLNGAGQGSAADLEQWQAACTQVKNQLRKVQAEIAKAKDANSGKAVMRLESVIKNLSGKPSTQQDFLELERWIGDDEVITIVDEPNPWGIPVSVRKRLLPVLAALKPQY